MDCYIDTFVVLFMLMFTTWLIVFKRFNKSSLIFQGLSLSVNLLRA